MNLSYQQKIKYVFSESLLKTHSVSSAELEADEVDVNKSYFKCYTLCGPLYKESKGVKRLLSPVSLTG